MVLGDKIKLFEKQYEIKYLSGNYALVVYDAKGQNDESDFRVVDISNENKHVLVTDKQVIKQVMTELFTVALT